MHDSFVNSICAIEDFYRKRSLRRVDRKFRVEIPFYLFDMILLLFALNTVPDSNFTIIRPFVFNSTQI